MIEKISSNNQEKGIEWNRQDIIFFKKIMQLGGIVNYVGTIENLREVFMSENINLCCIDERMMKKGTIRDAGCGILNQENALSEKMIEKLKKMGVKGVWSHKECGAAEIAFNKLNNEEKEKNIDANNYAQKWAKKMAEALGVEYLGHFDVEPNFHNARVIYYDGTGKFDPSQSDKFPPGFVISRTYLEEEYAKYITELAITIAFGDHGFGRKQFEDFPLQIILIGNPNDQTFSRGKLYDEVKEIVEKYKKVVKVDGFDAPVLAQKI